MTEPIIGADIGIGADFERRQVRLQIDLPGHEKPTLEILVPIDTGLELAQLLIEALRKLRAH